MITARVIIIFLNNETTTYLKNIWYHPLNKQTRVAAIIRFFKWQLVSRLLGYPFVFPFIGQSVLIIERGMAGATGNIYNGLHEYQDMLFTLHFLQPDDLFVDVGANVGTYTILASVNKGARVVSFEPITLTFQHLHRNVLLNNVKDKVQLINKAAANRIKTVYFTTQLDAGNHVIVDEQISHKEKTSIVCTTLDLEMTDKPALIKIDVEGYETEVIEGGKQTLLKDSLKAIIIELNGSGARYGFDEGNIHGTLTQYGFKPYSYDPFTRNLKPLEHWGTHNSIYIRDLEFVKERIAVAPKIVVNNLSL
jgi:FkbM family methyltransferase